jgi:hypothetical protein
MKFQEWWDRSGLSKDAAERMFRLAREDVLESLHAQCKVFDVLADALLGASKRLLDASEELLLVVKDVEKHT